MSKTATQTITHAMLLANDASFNLEDATALFDEIYQRYWFEFLKDRIKIITDFVSFAEGEYVTTSTTAVRAILNLMLDATPNSDSAALALWRDDFHAVMLDAAYSSPTGNPTTRWGAQKLEGGGTFRVAIYPQHNVVAPSTLTFDAEVLPEYTTPTTTTALDGDDVDAFNVARLTAVEIMIRNGEDPEDVKLVFGALERSVQTKFQYILERGEPNEHPQKEQ